MKIDRLFEFKVLANNLKILSFGLGILSLLILVNPTNPGFLGINPHPYLVISVILGAMLGYRVALILSLTLTAAYISCLLAVMDREQAETIFTLSTYIFCFSLVGIPLFLGVLSDRFRTNQRELELRLKTQIEVSSHLELARKTLIKEKAHAEGKVAAHAKTLERTLNFAQILEVGEINEVCVTLVDFVCEQIGEDNCYIYLFRAKDLKCVARRDEDAHPFPNTISHNEILMLPLLSHAIQTRKMTRSEDLPSKVNATTQLDEGGVVVPMITFSSQMVGVLMIRKARFINYVPSTFANLNATARWGAMCIARALRLQTGTRSSARDELTGLFSFDYFKKRVDAEWSRAQVHNLALHTTHIQIPEIESLSPLQRIACLKLCAKVIELNARTVDTVSIGNRMGSFYTIMLGASLHEVETYANRVRQEFRIICTKLKIDISAPLIVNRYSISKEQQSSIEFLSFEEAC